VQTVLIDVPKTYKTEKVFVKIELVRTSTISYADRRPQNGYLVSHSTEGCIFPTK
jgi:hypothetical protein